MKRKTISKSVRFRIFARDNFTCRYCGRQSDVVVLNVDHVTPVCQGGSNEPENLMTACEDCNAGKSGKTISQVMPTEEDRLRLSQERNEQVKAATAATEAREARERLKQEVVNFWCGCTGRSGCDRSTLQVVLSFVQTFGVELVFDWIERASARCPSDNDMGRYVSGCKRHHLEDMEQETKETANA